MAKPRLTLKDIKEELEKFKTLDEKKQYLEEVLRQIKDEKLKQEVQKLLDEASKHIEKHETGLTKDIPLEEKLGPSSKPIAMDFSFGPSPDIKYTLKKEQISLEQEAEKSTFNPPAEQVIGIKYAPPGAYDHQNRIESLRFYLSEQQQLVNKFTPDTWQSMTEERRRQVKDFVKQSLGLTETGSVETSFIVNNYISDLFSGGKPGEKYKTRL